MKSPLNLRLFGVTLTSITLLEFLSYFGYLAEPINQVCFMLILLTTFWLSLRSLEYGIWVVFAELVIGSKGYLFSWPIGDFNLSIRLGIFLVVFSVWVIQIIKTRSFPAWKSNLRTPYLVFMAALVYAGIMGLIFNHPLKNIFLDANGFLFFGLFFIILEVINSRQRVWNMLSVLSAASTAGVLKTFFLLFTFSHQLQPFISTIYRWVRYTGVGEITQLSNGFYRIFFQSHIYQAFAFFFLLVALCLLWKKISTKYWLVWYIRWVLAGSVILISLSRSLWLAVLGAGLVLFTWLRTTLCWSWKKILVSTLVLGASTALQLGVLGIIVNIPLPNTTNVTISSLVQERTSDVTQEAAGASRFALIKPLMSGIAVHPVWGQGFGTTISYASQDPRALQASNGGLYTTFSFEWGYLDLWLKLGALGLTAYGYFLWSIAKDGQLAWRHMKGSVERQLLVIGTILSGITLLIIHATTPYLNHPLGIGWIMLTAALFKIAQQPHTQHS